MKSLIVLLSALTLSACSSDERAPSPTAEKEQLIIQPQIDALEKSKQVQGMLDQAEQARRQAIDE